MILKFSFEISKNADILAFFLDFYAKKSNLKYLISKNEGGVSLFAQGSENELLKFSDEEMIYIPNFTHLIKSSVEVVDNFPNSKEHKPTNPNLCNITPYSIKEFFKDKKPIKNECGILSEISVGDELVNEENFDKLLDECFIKILHNQKVELKINNEKFQIHSDFLNEDNDFIMPTSLKVINKIFANDENSLLLLASYEKPIVSLKSNSIFRKNNTNAKNFYNVKAIKDLFLYALGLRLCDDNIYFLGVKSDIKFPKMLVAKDQILIADEKVNIKNNDELFTHFNISNKVITKIFLSTNFDDEISVLKGDRIFDQINFMKFNNIAEIKKLMMTDEISSKLIKNYEDKFEILNFNLDMKSNFYSMLDVVSKILFQKDANYLLDCADDFIMTKGLKIDCFIDDTNKFDLFKFIKTGMSYKLAGVDDKVLSFGYISSIAHFLSDYLDVLKQEFDYDEAILFGSMFARKSLSEAFLRISTNQNIKFFNEYPLEIL